jgi:hypothetical protein
MALAVLGGLSASAVVGVVLDTGMLLGRKAVFQHRINRAAAVTRQLAINYKNQPKPGLGILIIAQKSAEVINLAGEFFSSRSRDLKLIPIICGIALAILSVPFTSFSFALACGVTAATAAFIFNLALESYNSPLIHLDYRL